MRARWAAALLAIALPLAAGARADEGGAVVQTSCSIVRADESWVVYCYAQVANQTNRVLSLEEGVFDLLRGEEILASGQVEGMTPYFLGPGESGWLCDTVVFGGGENPPSITGIRYDLQYMTVEDIYASRPLEALPRGIRAEGGGLALEIEIVNTLDEEAWSPTVAFGLYSEGGALLSAEGRTLENVGIPAGGSALVRFDVPAACVERWEGYGVSASEIRAVAAFGGDED